MINIPDCFYRVSVKALVLNETRDKFLIVLEDNGKWELPGGGLDWGMTPQQDLPREIGEEMGLGVSWIADDPSYFLTFRTVRSGHKVWVANVLYEAELDSLDINPSEECVEVRFVDAEEVMQLPVFPNLEILAKLFHPKKHVR
jgi:ADP-ribose pyrophosphatase YjhB (NUDIX family)